eukprot:TRINITY_DN4768_c0_g1_i2.p1 TRINITY_DN4768_c0_g1~~TRINITY_DN4768_c0_g1_i2.p1  ORF type:complete len:1170 (+),score=311.65 TRINITY_DN4768_c0_g1_i2:168-3677(+)
MELSVLKSLKDKNILLTGSTGLVGKVLIEKLLRDVPELNKIFLLIRNDASERLEQDVLKSKLFERLQTQRGGSAAFKTYVHSKLVPIQGDALEDHQLGLSDRDAQLLREETHVVINCIASNDFRENLDDSIRKNVIGTLKLFDFAKAFRHLECFIHVSSAFVNCDRLGLHEEVLPPLHLDPDELIRLVLQMSPEQIEKSTSRIIGKYPNTYTFSKAVCEIMLERRRGRTPLAFVRPTIIGSSWREPFAGWIDSVSAIAAVILYTGVGLVRFVHGNHKLIADIVPVDIVANVVLAAIPATMEDPGRLGIYHVGTSFVNPVRWFETSRWVSSYWRQHNLKDRVDQQPVRFRFYKSKTMYDLQFFLKYEVPTGLYSLFAKTLGTAKHKKNAAMLTKVKDRTLNVTDSFVHFCTHEWVFSTKNTQSIMNRIEPSEKDHFFFDVQDIDWEKYFRFFCYGMQKFVLHEDVRPPTDLLKIDLIQEPRRTPEDTSLAFMKQVFPDITWASKTYKTQIGIDNFATLRTPTETKTLILNSPRVREAIKKVAEQEHVSEEVIHARAQAVIDRMGHNLRLPIVRAFGWFLRKVWKMIFQGIHVDETGLEELRKDLTKGPLLLIPTHRSYVDFLILSYLFYEFDLPLPHIAAGEDFLGILFVNWVLRNSGAFFLKRSFKGDTLYIALFTEYVQRLVCDWSPMEFFIEGKRSRTGKSLHPKFGMLSMSLEPYFQKKVPNMLIVPISISYEKALEAEAYSNELLGEQKTKESFEGLLRASRILKMNFGRIQVVINKPIDLKEFVAAMPQNSISSGANRKRGKMTSDDVKQIVLHLGYRIVYELNQGLSITATALVATILLIHRKGITIEDLQMQVNWLREEVTARGSTVAFDGSTSDLIERALGLFGPMVVRSRNLVSPAIAENTDKPQKHLLTLNFYRNQIVHLFSAEGMVACALSSCSKEGMKKQNVIDGAKFLNRLLWFEFVNKPSPDLEEDFEEVFRGMVEKNYLSEDKGIVNVTPAGEGAIAFLCHLFWPTIDSYWVAAISLYSLQPNLKVKKRLLLQRIQWMAEKMHSEDKLSFYESCSMETLQNTLDLYRKWHVLDFKYPNVEDPKATGKKIRKKEQKKVPSQDPVVFLLAPYQKEAGLQDLLLKISDYRKQTGGGTHRDGTMKRAIINDFPLLAKM